MVKWYRNGGCILRLFTDTITIYHKVEVNNVISWARTVVQGVQWTDHEDKVNNDGKISVARYASVTFPEGTYESLELDPRNEEDVIVYGEITEVITGAIGHRVSNILDNYTRSGRIKSVNNNANRPRLKNIKVTLG